MIWEGRQIADLRDKASDWKETTGRIVKLEDRSSRGKKNLEVRFSFFVQNRQAHGTRLSIAGPYGGWFKPDYELGDEVTVYYHPRYPQHAVLDRTAHPLEIKSYLFGGGIAAVPFVVFAASRIEKRRRVQMEHGVADSIATDKLEP